MLKHLSQRYRIHLGTFIDDEKDWKYLDRVKDLCGETCFPNLNPTSPVYVASPALSGQPLTLPYYRDSGLQAWVNNVLETRPIRNILVFSSAMAQYVSHARRRRIIDFVDIDSDKWMQYAADKNMADELDLSVGNQDCCWNMKDGSPRNFDSATFVSEAEADLFKRLAPKQ